MAQTAPSIRTMTQLLGVPGVVLDAKQIAIADRLRTMNKIEEGNIDQTIWAAKLLGRKERNVAKRICTVCNQSITLYETYIKKPLRHRECGEAISLTLGEEIIRLKQRVKHLETVLEDRN